ncbi:unnamed protein product [Allacma fusca]|uniref:Phospholipid scramblase n=1 Tax=Allacma fusca TaxID=39272 RepID=A0A8J2P8S6_9HEXA|nr:unnamed protein product [Allacma fusca]
MSIESETDGNDGLEPFNGIGTLFMQKCYNNLPFEISESLSRRFKVMNDEGRCIFWAGERVDCGSKCWRGMQRRFTFCIYSTEGDLVLTVDRQRLQTCSNWGCPSGTEKKFNSDMTNAAIMSMLNTYVYHFNGFIIGRLKNTSSAFRPQYEVEDENSYNILNIRSHNCGTICPIFSFCNSNFRLYDRHRNYLGEIRKSVTLVDSRHRNRRCVGATFPTHLSPSMKCLILSAMFELKVTYFERRLSTVEVLWVFVIGILLATTLLLLFMVTTFIERQ